MKKTSDKPAKPKATLVKARSRFLDELESFTTSIAASSGSLPPYFWVTVPEENPRASKGKPQWTGGLDVGRKQVHKLHLHLQQPSSLDADTVHKSTFRVAHGSSYYSNDLLTVASQSGEVWPLTSQQFLGKHFKYETRIERVVGEAYYAGYIDEWELAFKPLAVGGDKRWSLEQVLHR